MWTVGHSATSAGLQMIHNSEEWLIPYTVYAAIQRDLKRLEKWAGRHLVLFRKGKRKALHLGGNSPMHRYMLEASWLES